MQLKAILNRVQKFNSFVCGKARWKNEAQMQLEVEIIERANGRPLCSVCARAAPGYDRLPRRSFEFVPLWGIRVFLLYAPRRVACPHGGARVEAMLWALRQTPFNQSLCLISGALGTALVMERGRHTISCLRIWRVCRRSELMRSPGKRIITT